MALEDAWNLLKSLCPWCEQLSTTRDEAGNIVCTTPGCGYQGPADTSQVSLPTIRTETTYGPEGDESEDEFMEGRYGPAPEFKAQDFTANRPEKIREKMQAEPDTGEICPRCDSMNVKHTHTQQTRASDEPETKFYQCNDCGKKFRSYA